MEEVNCYCYCFFFGPLLHYSFFGGKEKNIPRLKNSLFLHTTMDSNLEHKKDKIMTILSFFFLQFWVIKDVVITIIVIFEISPVYILSELYIYVKKSSIIKIKKN
jgi:hypothetical protein